MYYEEEFIDTKLRSNNRTLVLKPVDGKKAASSTGLVDPRLFTGGNNLHAIKMPLGGISTYTQLKCLLMVYGLLSMIQEVYLNL